ncbi:hypothetical protein D9M70_628060 [compost metagenome]
MSTELLEELKEELRGKKLPETSSEILEDLVQNLQKISHHGKRASGIVKNMLEHSRASTGERQQVNINALVEEYIKLSFMAFVPKINRSILISGYSRMRLYPLSALSPRTWAG